ncbi:MAG: cysteine synthase family protein [Phycisphaerales bacterium]|nr:cysteine synthase family protein [Phycisphaerales bacterium]
MPPIAQSVSDLIGRTPLLRAARFAPGCNLLFKCEFMNPGGSVKDRIGFAMIEDAERRGLLRPGGTIVEATASNTGLALAMAAAIKGYKLVTVMTTKTSPEKVALMRAVGAEVVIVPREAPLDSPDNFQNKARAIAAERPGAWWSDQFSNAANVAVHYETTAREIWEQTDGQVDAIVAGVGTGGSLTGIGRFLKEKKPSAKVILADPVGSVLANLVEGREPGEPGPYQVEGMGGVRAPANLDLSIVDVAVRVSDREAFDTAAELFRTEGVFVGGSSGCIAAAARRYCREVASAPASTNPDASPPAPCVVALLTDGGRSYLSTVYDSDWRDENGV